MIIVLVFLPLMTLEGTEGKMFAPLAYTIAIALMISLALSLTLSPALSMFWLKGGSEKDTRFVGWLRRPYEKSPRHRHEEQDRKCSRGRGICSQSRSACSRFSALRSFRRCRKVRLGPNADRVPNISLDESIKMELQMQRLMRDIPGIEKRGFAPRPR